MLSTFLLIIITLCIALLLYAKNKPDLFQVSRSQSIQASVAQIFPLINSLRNQSKWGPWEKEDPNMHKSLSGPEFGVGAIYEWSGNAKVGKGRIEIVEVIPNSQVILKLDMLALFASNNRVEFTLTPNGNSTEVTWSMAGQQPYLAKVMGIIINCERLCGNQFTQGLENLKNLVEANQ